MSLSLLFSPILSRSVSFVCAVLSPLNPSSFLPPTPPPFKDEEPLLTPPLWDSHLPIFLPVDRQPPGVAMEGETHRP